MATQANKGGGRDIEEEMKLYRENLVKDARALGSQGAVSNQIFPCIATLETAKASWDILKQEFVGDKQGLCHDFEYTHMSKSESLAAYLARLFDLINQMKSYGEDLSNQRIVQKLLISLPKTYDSIASVIENTKGWFGSEHSRLFSQQLFFKAQQYQTSPKDIEVIDAQDVVAILKGYEVRLARHGESSTKRAFASLNISSKNGVRNETSNIDGACKYYDKLHYGECWLKGKIKFHKCGKLGQIARVCNLNKNVQQGNFANKVEEPRNLLLDLLVDIDKSIKAKVQVGTRVLVDVKGIGTLVIDTKKGKRYIREVMLVPGLAENLLSVGQMTKHRYFLVFYDYKGENFYDRTLTNLVEHDIVLGLLVMHDGEGV
ncbi:unnamed protein product [Malus baccata var. baccata]